MVKQNATVLLEDARIGFRNFSGKEGPYNRSGDRNFSLFLEPDIAKAMEEDGWNIRYLTPRDEGDIPQALLEEIPDRKHRFCAVCRTETQGCRRQGVDQGQAVEHVDVPRSRQGRSGDRHIRAGLPKQ